MKQKITMRAVEKFVEKHPDGKNIRGWNGSYTYFNRGEDNNGAFKNPKEVRPGCLFGHIIASLGGEPNLVEEDLSIDFQDKVLSSKLSRDDKSILLAAQQRADSGVPWGTALALAKKRYGASS